MIYQVAYLKTNKTISQEDKDKFDSYPGIVIKSHIMSPLGTNYTVRFEHENKLTTEDFGLSPEWLVGEQSLVRINPPKTPITNNQ